MPPMANLDHPGFRGIPARCGAKNPQTLGIAVTAVTAFPVTDGPELDGRSPNVDVASNWPCLSPDVSAIHTQPRSRVWQEPYGVQYMLVISRKAAADLNAPDASSSRTRREPCRSSSSPGDCHRAAQRRRPSTTPTYYQGRPAWFWLERFRRSDSRTWQLPDLAHEQVDETDQRGRRA
jgi:hypothetical protein